MTAPTPNLRKRIVELGMEVASLKRLLREAQNEWMPPAGTLEDPDDVEAWNDFMDRFDAALKEGQ